MERIDQMERSSEKKPIFDFRDIQARYPSKYPAIASPAIAKLQPIPDISLSLLRQMCDLCQAPSIVECDGSIRCGAATTHRNADKLVFLRDLAELALKFYNDTNVGQLKSFKLVKVCKINCVAAAYYGLTFRAQEDGSEECLVFRGVVHVVGGRKALFCEIKDDDEIKLLPGDDDYDGSECACKSEDGPPCLRKNDLGNGSAADSGDCTPLNLDLLDDFVFSL